MLIVSSGAQLDGVSWMYLIRYCQLDKDSTLMILIMMMMILMMMMMMKMMMMMMKMMIVTLWSENIVDWLPPARQPA